MRGVAQWQLGQGVVEEHLHAQAFRSTDTECHRAVTDDTQLLPRISKELAALLIQPPRWQERSSQDAAQQQDGLGQHQLRTERVLEYGALNTASRARALR